MKDNEFRELVNTLRDVALQHHDHESLRERIRHALIDALKNQDPAQPDDSDLEDMARSEFESAMAFGVSIDNFMRLARSVAEKCGRGTQPAPSVPDVDVLAQFIREADGIACAAVAEHVLANGGHVTVTCNGKPKFEITVRELAAGDERGAS